MEHPFTHATHKKLIHRTSSMRAYNNHIYTEFRGLVQDCFFHCALYKKGCCIQACAAQAICNLLYLEMLTMESFRKGIPDRLWARI